MSKCPDFPERCGAHDPRQRRITPVERERLDEPQAKAAARACVCSYCGLIYTKRWGRVARIGHLTDMAGHNARQPAKGHGGTYA